MESFLAEEANEMTTWHLSSLIPAPERFPCRRSLPGPALTKAGIPERVAGFRFRAFLALLVG
ncbi:hypothetical protein T261_8020 [Streptomyces lydicus]|nr:hypothetical protein T261_8020 [Streptomyces lydicus]